MAKDKDTKDAPATKDTKETTPEDAELAAQLAVVDAVFGATHGKDGEPIPIVVPEPEP